MVVFLKVGATLISMKLLHILFTTLIAMNPFFAVALSILIPLFVWNIIENRDHWGKWFNPDSGNWDW